MTRGLVDSDTLLQLYRTAVRCRSFEQVFIRFALEDGIGVGHPYLGQEAVAAGVICSLETSDRVVSTHRTHGHAVAKGCDLKRLAAELYGKADGLGRGRAGEMYLAQYSVGYMGGTQIVGGNLPMSVGLALAANLSKSQRVVVAFIGDGGTNQGTFHESLNLASIWKLPLVLVVENNLYAETTPAEYAVAGEIVDRAKAYSIPGLLVDGQDAAAVYLVSTQCVARARSGLGPSLIEARTYRYEGHYYGDRHRRYRLQTEVEAWKARDPLTILFDALRVNGYDASELERIRDTAVREAEDACSWARSSAAPTWSDLSDGVFAEHGRSRSASSNV